MPPGGNVVLMFAEGRRPRQLLDGTGKRARAQVDRALQPVRAVEAVAIGERIGVKPASVPGRDSFKGFDWGPHNPCTFLKDGECSIYENRPLACRVHFSLDVDAMLCDVSSQQPWPVPYLNTLQWQTAMLKVMEASADDVPKLGDIREFFPRGKR